MLKNTDSIQLLNLNWIISHDYLLTNIWFPKNIYKKAFISHLQDIHSSNNRMKNLG